MNRTFVSLIKSTHPIPSVAVALFSVLFGVGVGLDPLRISLVGVAVLFQQFSVGLSNDWLDYARDQAVERKDKPTARGMVSPQLVRNYSVVAAVVAVVVSVLLGIASALWMIPMLIVGWAYNLGMKSNWLSVLPYAVGFGILPVFVTLSLPEPTFPPAWVVTVAALLGTSAHFANALPDLFEDKATGVRALPHIVGQRWSALIIAVTAVVATVVVLNQAGNLNPVVAWVGFSLTVLLAGSASLLSLKPQPPRIIFPLLMLASLVNVVLLMLGLGSITS